MFGVIALVVLAAIFWTLRTPPLEVDAARVLEAPLTVTINDEGETRVRDMFVVAAPINGRLLRVDLDAGDPVIAGSTIVAKIMPSQPDFLNPRSDAETRAQIQALQANVPKPMRTANWQPPISTGSTRCFNAVSQPGLRMMQRELPGMPVPRASPRPGAQKTLPIPNFRRPERVSLDPLVPGAARYWKSAPRKAVRCCV